MSTTRGLHAFLRTAPAPAWVTAALALGAAWRAAPLRTPDGAPADGRWQLHADAAYLALAPLHGVLDALTMLTPPQHAAVVLTIVGLAAWRGGRRAPCAGAAWRGAVRGGGVALAAVVASYLLGGLLPRPMARLTGARADELVVDFHAHTQASWDRRTGWSRDRLRDWLAGSGFDAAYVTDHGGLPPVDWAVPERRRLPGEPLLLPGVEARAMGEHVNVLGVTQRDAGWFRDRQRRVHVEDLPAVLARAALPPVLLVTIPMTREEPLVPGQVHALEVNDAAPRGLAFGWRHRVPLARLADSLRLVRVSGSDQHGWGRAAVAWTVLRIDGWRALDPEALERRVRAVLLGRGRAPLVLERPPLPGTGTAAGTVLTVPLVAHALVTRLAWPERLAWLAWAWGAWRLAPVAARARRRARALRRAWRGRARAVAVG